LQIDHGSQCTTYILPFSIVSVISNTSVNPSIEYKKARFLTAKASVDWDGTRKKNHALLEQQRNVVSCHIKINIPNRINLSSCHRLQTCSLSMNTKALPFSLVPRPNVTRRHLRNSKQVSRGISGQGNGLDSSRIPAQSTASANSNHQVCRNRIVKIS
jgi:hypothetical protein